MKMSVDLLIFKNITFYLYLRNITDNVLICEYGFAFLLYLNYRSNLLNNNEKNTTKFSSSQSEKQKKSTNLNFKKQIFGKMFKIARKKNCNFKLFGQFCCKVSLKSVPFVIFFLFNLLLIPISNSLSLKKIFYLK